MVRVALAGNIGSGKSTVAKELSTEGFFLLNYTELIKEEVAKAMVSVGVFTTIEDALEQIKLKKEFYRPLLVAWADTCGWSDGKQLENFLKEMQEKAVVLDNLRYLAQADIVKRHGFLVFKLEGGNRMDIPELINFHFDATIPWMESLEKRMKYVMHLLPTLQK